MKNYIKILIITILLLIIGMSYIFLPFILGKHIKAIKADTEIETSEWFQNRVQQYDIIRCKFGFTKMVYAFVYENKYKDMLDHHIYFFDINKNNLFSTTINSEYTGGTTIENTTFDELVKMTEKDCFQFQHAKGDYRDETINWSYSLARTQEKNNEDTINNLLDDYFSYTDEAREVYREIYGNPNDMTDEKKLELYNKIKQEGVDERIVIKNTVSLFHQQIGELTDKQRVKVRATYGDWEELTDEELKDYSDKIAEDYISGKFTLD
jgi:hypothetical protein